MMENLENIKHIDDDEGSDSDSLNSNHVEHLEDDGQPGKLNLFSTLIGIFLIIFKNCL